MRYNGHKNHASWNIALWINNDEGLYCLAKACLKVYVNPEMAASDMLKALAEMGVTATPDGVKFTKKRIKRSLKSII